MARPLGVRVYSALYDLDLAANALLGGRQGETISGSLGRALERRAWWAPLLVHLVNLGAFVLVRQENHCQKAAKIEALRLNWAEAHPDPYA